MAGNKKPRRKARNQIVRRHIPMMKESHDAFSMQLRMSAVTYMEQPTFEHAENFGRLLAATVGALHHFTAGKRGIPNDLAKRRDRLGNAYRTALLTIQAAEDRVERLGPDGWLVTEAEKESLKLFVNVMEEEAKLLPVNLLREAQLVVDNIMDKINAVYGFAAQLAVAQEKEVDATAEPQS